MKASTRIRLSYTIALAGILWPTPPLHGQDVAKLPSNQCVAEFTLPDGATFKTSDRDYGTKRTLSYDALTPGTIYQTNFEIRFPSGQMVSKRVLIEGGRRVKVAMLDPAVGRPEVMLQSNDTTGDVAWSKDGRYVLAGRTLCDAKTGRHLRQFPNPTQFLWGLAVAISPDNSLVALAAKASNMGSGIDRIFVYKLATGQLVHKFEGVRTRALSFGPKSRTLFASGFDTRGFEKDSIGVTQVWDVRTGKTVRVIRSNRWISTMALSVDGKTMVTW